MEGRYAEAEKLHRKTVEISQRVLGPEHSATLETMSGLAGTLQLEGHYPEAEKLQREVLDIRRRVLGPEHPETLMSMSALAWTLVLQGHHAESREGASRDARHETPCLRA